MNFSVLVYLYLHVYSVSLCHLQFVVSLIGSRLLLWRMQIEASACGHSLNMVPMFSRVKPVDTFSSNTVNSINAELLLPHSMHHLPFTLLTHSTALDPSHTPSILSHTSLNDSFLVILTSQTLHQWRACCSVAMTPDHKQRVAILY